MGLNVDSVRRIHKKILSMELDGVKPSFGNKKYVDTERRIVTTGESIHDDREVITKQRIHVKGNIGRPTINNHWDNVNDYFNELNKILEDGTRDR